MTMSGSNLVWESLGCRGMNWLPSSGCVKKPWLLFKIIYVQIKQIDFQVLSFNFDAKL